jgi:hypothetical protein
MRVTAEYLSYCDLNGFNIIEGVRYWIGGAIRDGIAPGTLDTYFNYLLPMLRRSTTPDNLPLLLHCRAIVAALHADADTGGATPATVDVCCQAIAACQEAKLRLTLNLLTMTGLRLKDLRRLRRRQIRISAKRVDVQVRLSKNRRRRCLRRVLTIEDWQDKLQMNMDPRLLEILNEQSEEVSPRLNLSPLRDVNKHLRLFGCTSYSLRKFFINSMIRHFSTVKNGQLKTDWNSVLEMTLHTKIDIVRAHYAMWLAASDND